MKTVFFLLAVCCLANIALAITEEEFAVLLRDKEVCIQESGVDPAAIEQAKKGIMSDDEKLACFASCIMQKLGVMDADLTTHPDVALKILPASISREKAQAIIDRCSNISANNACLKGGLILKCILQDKDVLLGN